MLDPYLTPKTIPLICTILHVSQCECSSQCCSEGSSWTLSDLLIQLSWEGLWAGQLWYSWEFGIHEPVVTLTAGCPTAPGLASCFSVADSLSEKQTIKPQLTARPKKGDYFFVTWPALTGKGEEMNTFSTRFLSKILAINIFLKRLRAIREGENIKIISHWN